MIVRRIHAGALAGLALVLASAASVAQEQSSGPMQGLSVNRDQPVKIESNTPRVAQKNRTVSGENGVYDLKANTITMTGKVMVKQGQNVLRGKRVVVDLTTGVMRVESGKVSGRLEGNSIVLREHVVVTSVQDYNAELLEAAVDMKKGNVASEKPVVVNLPNGTLVANGIEIFDSGDVVHVTRGVVLNLDGAEGQR